MGEASGVLIVVGSEEGDAPAGSVRVTVSMPGFVNVMIVPDTSLPVVLFGLRQLVRQLGGEENLGWAENSSSSSDDPDPIPDAMLVECEPRVGDKCMICLEEAEGHPVAAGACPPVLPWISLSRCGHRFHPGCIRQWPRPHCPVCRASHAA
jgi:hypothetical protein